MKQRNKMIALLLATTMCCAALTGCGSTKVDQSSEAKSEVKSSEVKSSEVKSSEQASSEPAEPLKNVDIYPLDSDQEFTVVTTQNIFGDTGESIVTMAMERATGVSIDWKSMTAEQLKLTLGGKENLPDAIFNNAGGMDKATAYEYGDAGFFVNFMDYLDIMPNFSALIEAHPEWLDAIQNEDGSVYCLPTIGGSPLAYGNLIFYRTDMMKEIGWENPPATTDEFLQYIKELQEHFGKDDPEFIAVDLGKARNVSPVSGTCGRYFFASFGELLREDYTLNSKGEVVYGAASEQYKNYLKFMIEVWNSGAFNTNVYTQDEAVTKARSAGGHVSITASASYYDPSMFESGKIDIAIMPPLTSEYWDTPHWYQAPRVSWGRLNMITTACEDIETMVKWFDAWYSTEENPLNEEGTLFGITPFMGEIGVDVILDRENMTYVEAPHEGIEDGKFMATQSFDTFLYTGFEDGYLTYLWDMNTYLGVWGKAVGNNLYPYAESHLSIPSLALNEEERDIYNQYWLDIEKYTSQTASKFITGELSIEADWDDYLANLENMGLSKVLAAFQAAYDRTK